VSVYAPCALAFKLFSFCPFSLRQELKIAISPDVIELRGAAKYSSHACMHLSHIFSPIPRWTMMSKRRDSVTDGVLRRVRP